MCHEGERASESEGGGVRYSKRLAKGIPSAQRDIKLHPTLGSVELSVMRPLPCHRRAPKCDSSVGDVKKIRYEYSLCTAVVTCSAVPTPTKEAMQRARLHYPGWPCCLRIAWHVAAYLSISMLMPPTIAPRPPSNTEQHRAIYFFPGREIGEPEKQVPNHASAYKRPSPDLIPPLGESPFLVWM